MLGRRGLAAGTAASVAFLVTLFVSTPAHAQILLDRLTLKGGTVITGKIISDSSKFTTVFTTEMDERVIPSQEIATFEKIETDGNPFRARSGRVFLPSIVTTVRLKDGKELRGVSLDRQGNNYWLLSPEAFLLQVPMGSIEWVMQEPYDRAARPRTEASQPSTAYAPEQAPPPIVAPPPEQATKPQAEPAARADASLTPVGLAPPPARFYGALLFGFHDQTSGPLEEFYGSGLLFGAQAGYHFARWAGARVAAEYFSKSVIDPDGKKWELMKLPIEAGLFAEPFGHVARVTPYIGFGLGMTYVSQAPDYFVLRELERDSSSSDFLPHYQLFAGARIPIWRRLNGIVEFRYSSAPFEDTSHNLNGGGIDFLMGARW